jgi:replicative DNA helicase
MPIYQTNTLIKAQTQILKQYQSGKVRIVRTARPHIDATLTGLLPGDIVVIAGASGAGKTFELQTLRENIMSKEINPDADDYVFLDYSFEMKLFNLILRGVSKILGKKKKDVLLTEFTEDERPLANRYIKTLTDNRFFIDEDPCTPSDFLTQTSLFLDQHKDKRAVFVSIDHMGLFKSEGNKKDSIDKVVEDINILKRKYSNVYFLLLSQLNRSILARIAEKNITSMPNRGDVYQSDTMFQIADYLIVVHNPHRLGISQYLRVNPRIYENLEEFFSEGTAIAKKVSFETFGNIFYHVLKVREGEVIFQDIFIESIKSDELEAYKKESIDTTRENFDDLDLDGEDEKKEKY